MSPREEFSSITRRLAWARANGRCEGIVPGIFDVPGLFDDPVRCDAPIDIGEFHYDHINPEWLSFNNDLANCQVLCRECHRIKTKGDVKTIAKVKRIRDKRIKARRPRGRPLLGTKRSGIRKRMSGRVERW